jgi:cell division protein FtsL
MAALDWFAPDVAPPPARAARPPRAAPRPRPRTRPRGRRVTGGIFWISAFAVLLAGVVAINVAVLRVNMRLNDLNQQQLQLQAQNQALASNVSSAASSLRIEQIAQRLGLQPAPASDTSYLNLLRK